MNDTPLQIDIVFGNIVHSKTDAIVVSTAKTAKQKRPSIERQIVRANIQNSKEKICELSLSIDSQKPIPTGRAILNFGYAIPSRYLICVATPFFTTKKYNACEMLFVCYYNALKICQKYQIKTVAFPALGAGKGGFPILHCAKIALESVCKSVETISGIEKIVFVCNTNKSFIAYQNEINRICMVPKKQQKRVLCQ